MFKSFIASILAPEKPTRSSVAVDWLVTALIVASVTAVFLSTFELPSQARRALGYLEAFASIVFTVEYALRFYIAKNRRRYVFSPMALVDLAAILPFYLPMLLPPSMLGMRILRLSRLLRVLKLNRYFEAVARVGRVIRDKRRELVGSSLFVLLVMVISSLLMYSCEHDAQPEVFRNAFSGLWWAVATLTTVGYGDIYPVTAAGKILGAVIALSGVGVVAIPTGIITSGLLENSKPEKRICPHCGREIG
ncbi:MAG: ion transporter [Kiritimatiellae bacterium]|nr:ion transporter [Kiritimatiellia bacterium]